MARGCGVILILAAVSDVVKDMNIYVYKYCRIKMNIYLTER